MQVNWNIHGSRPDPLPAVGTWRLEHRPLSWFKNWHRLNDEKTEAALKWFQPAPGEHRPPTDVPQAYDDGLLRDGHHRVHALKILGKDPAMKVPVWVLHRSTDVTQQPTQQPTQLARSQAPAGGAIVNRQYLPGGRFLPRALLSIRAGVLKRKNRSQLAAQKAAGNPRGAAYSEPEKMIAPAIAAAGGAILRGAAAILPRVAAVGGRAAAAEGAAAGGGRAAGMGLSDLAGLIPSPPSRQSDQSAQFAAADRPQVSMGLTDVVKPKLLAPGSERQTFKPRDIKKIEDAHGIAPEHRLKHTVNADGTVSTRLDDFYNWQDQLAAHRLGRDQLHKVLNDPETPDDVKEQHLFHHVAHDATNLLRHTSREEASKWYGESVRGWEAAMHHLFSRERPGDPTSPHIKSHPKWGSYDEATGQVTGSKPWMRLAKGVLAYTSGDTTPAKNARAAVRMLKSALRANPNNPFAALPEKDHDSFEEWKDKAHKTLLLPKAFPLERAGEPGQDRVQRLKDAWAWHERHGKLLDKAKVDRGYSTVKIYTDKRTGQPVAVQPFKSGMPAKPWPGLTQDQVNGMIQRREVGQAEIPNVGEDGNLQPKGWGKQSAAITASNKRIARLVADRGDEGAADFLESRVPVKDIKGLNAGFSWGGEPADTHGLGSFIFGPKFGRFFANISGNKDHFTLDKWMARLGYSYMGAVMDSKGHRAESPRNAGDEKLIRAAFHRAAKHLNLPIADLQAVMWELAQRVPNLFGVSHEQEDFKSGGRQILEDHGFDPGLVEPRRATATPRKAAAAGGRVPGDVAGGRGGPGGARAGRRAVAAGAAKR